VSCLDENSVLAFVDGRLTGDALSSAEAHVASCATCADLVAAAAGGSRAVIAGATAAGASAVGLTLALTKGDSVGRHVILGLVGRGGMGDVYAAYDPELDRKVALKVLRSRSARTADGEARLLREAQAIAKLSHPNVVVVYEVGTVRDDVFIAMEFVDGVTVGRWLAQEARSVADVLGVFLAAGRGLGAAHDAGIIHRDFKPENVMVTGDGQVRVMDFGLARPLVSEPEPAAEAEDGAATGGAPGAATATATATAAAYLQLKITQTGVQVGTPAYMAPEQFRMDERIDARTDQFSFCVALYEALHGERPFRGDSVGALRDSVLGGKLRPPPAGTRVPAWLRRVLLRGLSRDPAARWESMGALLAALERDPRARRRRALVGAGAVALMVGLAVAGHRIGTGERTVCTGGGARLAGIWEPAGAVSERKQAIHRAFVATGVPYAEQAFAVAARLLDDYAGRWSALYKDACEATHLRGEQSAEVLDLRMTCLQERLGNVRALSDVFAAADQGVVVNAPSAAGALPGLDRCSDVPLLRAVVKPPDDPAVRKRVDELRGKVAHLVATRNAGRCREALALSGDLIAAVRATSYRPLLAETLNAAAVLGNDCGEPAQAVDRMKEAYVVASAGRDDQAAAEAAAMLPVFAVNRLGDVALARDWLRIAEGALERLGDNPVIQSWLLQSEGSVRITEHDYQGAVDASRRALEIKQRLFGPDHPETILGLESLAATLQAAGRLEEARSTQRTIQAAMTRVLGAEHPAMARNLNNEGEVLAGLGRPAEAADMFERALAIWRRAGSERVYLSYGLSGLGQALLAEGRAAESVAPLEEALAIREQNPVPPVEIAETRFALARALATEPAARPRALDLARRARADLGDADPKIAAEIDAWLSRPPR
jgi:tetratricopeptide (TPR) repeat protein